MKAFCSTVMFLLFTCSTGIHGQSLLPPIYCASEIEIRSGFSRLKNTEEEVQKPDSTLQENRIDSTSEWVNAGRRVYTYNAYGHILLILDYFWDESSGRWVYSYRNEYTYYAGTKLALYVSSAWDEIAGTWYGASRHEYSYDANGNETTVISSDWDFYTNDWVYYSKKENDYDAVGKVASFTSYNWEAGTSQWFINYKNEQSYDQDGNDTLINIYTINPENGELEVSHIIKYAYDYNGYRISFLEITRPDSATGWVNHYKSEFTNDTFGNPTLSILYYWNEIASEWVANIKESYDYDAAGHVTLYKEYLNNDTPVEWDSTMIKEFEYDESGNLVTEIVHGKSPFTGKWSTKRNINYYSVHDITQISAIPEHTSRVFPNPASYYIVFDVAILSESAAVELFDSQGRRVLENRIIPGEHVPLGGLAPGIYMYRVTDGGKIYHGKIVKE